MSLQCDGKVRSTFPSILGKAFGFSRGRQKIRSMKKIRGEKNGKRKNRTGNSVTC